MEVAVILKIVLLVLITTKSYGLSQESSANILYVRPENSPNSTCPGLPCDTLDHYANVSHSNNTRFLFLPGLHKLRENFRLRQMQSIQFVGVEANGTFIAEKHDRPRIQCNVTDSPAGFIFENVDFLIIQNLDISSCGQVIPTSVYNFSAPLQAALVFKSVLSLTMQSVIVQHSLGYGISAKGLYGNTSIERCHFDHNNGTSHYVGGNVGIVYQNCPQNSSNTFVNINITSTIFSNGTSIYRSRTNGPAFAPGLIFEIYTTCSFNRVHIHLQNVTFENNTAHGYASRGGNLYIHCVSTDSARTALNIEIIDSFITSGKANKGGGVHLAIENYKSSSEHDCSTRAYIHDSIIFRNVTFKYNRGSFWSGALYIMNVVGDNVINKCPIGQITILNCTFEKNLVKSTTTDTGVAIHIYRFMTKGILSTSQPWFTIVIQDTVIKNNTLHIWKSQSQISGGAALYVAHFRKQLEIVNSTFIDNQVSAIATFRSNIVFKGHVILSGNIAIFGGGLVLCEESYVLLSANTSVLFDTNRALQLGGAIYTSGQCLESYNDCFYQIYLDENQDFNSVLDTVHVIMQNNTAGKAGSQIYGGSLDSCRNSYTETKLPSLYDKAFNESLWQYNSSDQAYVTSTARYVCFCENGTPNCSKITWLLDSAIYSGQTVIVLLAAVGQFDHPVPTAIRANVTDEYRFIRKVEAKCDKMEFKVLSNCTFEKLALLVSRNEGYSLERKKESRSSFSGKSPRYIDIHYKECPLGFITSVQGCVCDPGLPISCDIVTETITTHPPAWIGVHHNGTKKTLMYYSSCPSDRCSQDNTTFRINSTSFIEQCGLNRSGILCGECSPSHSLSMGSSKCLDCSNSSSLLAPIVVIIILTAGVLVVVLISACNITLTDCTLSGLFFYVNIADIYQPVLVEDYSQRNTWTYIINWINLSVGFNMCFYKGFDEFAKTVLKFSIPLYLWTIAGLIIFLSSRSSRVASLTGKNAVQVLATLFYLSYTKILQTVADAFSCGKINYHDTQAHNHTWMKDGNVPCWQGKHLVLVVIGSLFVVLTVLYTLVLLFVQPLQRYSHLRGLRWVFRIKPFIDAHTCPHVIKDKYRFWMGLLLLFRLLFVISYSSNFSVHMTLLTYTLLCVLIITTAWCVGGVYKKWWLNVLNALSYLNLAFLSMSTQYSSFYKYEHTGRAHFIQRVSLFIAFIIFLSIILCHFLKRLKEWRVHCLLQSRFWRAISLRYRDWRERRYQRVPQEEGEENDRELQDEFDGEREIESDRESDDSNNRYREPLLS